MRYLVLLLLLLPAVGFTQTDPVKDSIERIVEDLAKPVYIETYKIVNTAKYKINNAINGRYPAKEAMSYYNENLSKYMGSYKTIQAVKKRLDTAGDAFVEVMYLTAKGRIAKELADRANEEALVLQAERSFESKRKTQSVKDASLITPPEASNSDEELVISRSIDYSSVIFTKVEKEAQYPGDWGRYLTTNLREEVPVENGASPGNYQVIVQFVVDVQGNVSDVKVIKDPGFGMGAEAVRVIKKSGKWKPAIQNGREVKAYCKLPIAFIVQ
ncbi:energy transducer TonB [Niabella sp.]|uniref:energy transducer TonB n=1 Tax=Niabella sp. TaxID=1962976 RepID=UPI00261B601C|nr:energy transducer TonB [Niabella sp.]